MSGRILPLDPTNHKAVQELLPWFISDTLGEREQALVREHLHGCSQCQADLDWQRKLQAAEPAVAAGAEFDVERALGHLMPRLTEQPRQPALQSAMEFLRRMFNPEGMALRSIAAGQMVIIAGLALVLAVQDRDGGTYRLLGAHNSAGGGNVVVVFKPDTTERDLRRILHASSARVVNGPTATDAYVLDVPEAQQAQAIRSLRAEAAVVMAESLSMGAPR